MDLGRPYGGVQEGIFEFSLPCKEVAGGRQSINHGSPSCKGSHISRRDELCPFQLPTSRLMSREPQEL